MCLSDFRANLAVHLARSPLNHSYSYASADDSATCCAIFTLKPNPSCNMRVSAVPLKIKRALHLFESPAWHTVGIDHRCPNIAVAQKLRINYAVVLAIKIIDKFTSIMLL